VLNSTNPTASSAIGRMFARIWVAELSSAAEYSSGGRIPYKTRFGSSW